MTTLLVGCGGGLKLTSIRNAHTRPSNVAAYFKVQTGGGDPVGGLSAEQFKIYEDGQLVSQYESKQVILNPEVAASHYTMLLVDMSGSVAADSAAVDSVVEAAAAFSERVEKTQRVGVYAFDGCGKLHPIAGFTNPGGAAGAVKSLKGYKPDDPSTDLHGAMTKGIVELDGALAHAEHPMHFGTIVVFTDGTDRAGRTSRADMSKAIDDTKYEVFAIGLGTEMKESELKRIGKTGTAQADNKAAVLKAFDDIAQRIEASSKSYYLLSYCSPSRAGKHKLRVEAEWKGEEGKATRSGSFESDFDATGFGPGCDPKQAPNFDVHKGDALAPPPPKDRAERSEKREDKREEKRERTRPRDASKPEPKTPPKDEGKPAPAKPAAGGAEFSP